MSNQIRVIHPYWDQGQLVFDDPSVGLVKEPFVANADNVLSSLAVSVDSRCQSRFTILFSDQPFAGFQFEAIRIREEYGGNWYTIAGEEGWLCPALFKYFESAPERIFFQIKPVAECGLGD